MTTQLDGDVIRLEGDCLVEEAEHLAALLDGQTERVVDLSACRQMHGAVLQALLWYGPTLRGAPADPFLREWRLPSLEMRWRED